MLKIIDDISNIIITMSTNISTPLTKTFVRPLCAVAFFVFFGLVFAGVADAHEMRINTGGLSFVDTGGNTWEADAHFNTGNTFSTAAAISNTADDLLYQTERWDDAPAPELAYAIPVANGDYMVTLHFAEIWSGAFSIGARVFDVGMEGITVLDNIDIYAEAGANTALTKTFTATVTDGALDILFTHVVQNPKIAGIEVMEHEEETHLMHVVAGPDQTVVDDDGDGAELVTLDAGDSHTHAFGETIVSWVWAEGVETIGTTEVITAPFSVGVHEILLVATDSAGNTGSDAVMVTVLAPNDVPGLAGYYFDFTGTPLTSIPDVSALQADWAQIEPNLNYDATSGNFAGTPFSENFAARYTGFIDIPVGGSYGFAIESDDGSRLFIDDALLINNDGLHAMKKMSAVSALSAGMHKVMIEFFEASGQAGLKFYWTPPAIAEQIVPSSALFYEYPALLPVINVIDPLSGPEVGGNKVTINGFGFIFSVDETTVNFGGTALTGSSLTIIDENTIEVIAPAGIGTVAVSVATPNSVSKGENYLYIEDAPPPVLFTSGTLFSGINGPTSLAFGPDGKLYVGTQFGTVWVLTLDDNLNVINSYSTGIIQDSESTFRSILGIAFNPLDDPLNPKLYVAHSFLFHGDDIDFYKGKISTLSGPGLSVKEDIITGLPVSDHDHGMNGMEFGMKGEMYIQVGGNTNAGVPGVLSSSGELDEGALSAATLVAHLERENFDGNVTHNSAGEQTGGFDVEVFASGFRNPYDLVLHSNGGLYGTDNGPNFGYGGKSTGCAAEGPDPEEPDELNLIVENGYYGHANRLRGASDPRQCVWRSIFEPSDAQYTAPMTTFTPSTNGITEYRSNTFGGQLKGHLLASRWEGELYDVELSGDGKSVASQNILTPQGGLDVTTGPDGTIFIAQHLAGKIIYHKPSEPVPSVPHIISATPYRGPLTGERTALITGSGLNAGGMAMVTFGGKNCPTVSVTSTAIKCMVPAGDAPGAVDIVVTTAGMTAVLPGGYTYMDSTLPPPPPLVGKWFAKVPLPIAIGEMSAAAIGDFVYVLAGHGEGAYNDTLYRYDTMQNVWESMAPQTVAPLADHAAVEVINGKIYMFGGILPPGEGESNTLAIYNPVTDAWSLGSPLMKEGVPYGLGSVASGVIGGKLYIAGGIHDGNLAGNPTDTFVYNPVADIWTELAPMPSGRNHAAGVGYSGKFYVFSGRQGENDPNELTFDDSYVYDPSSNTWGMLAPIPTPRGGMGTAVALLDELFVIGGEGGGPSSGTYPNVEAYNPVTNTWRALPDLPTPRHGIYPVLVGDDIHVVAGGTMEGHSHSAIHEMYNPYGIDEHQAPSAGIRINTGGLSFVDTGGNTWEADAHFNTGNTFSTAAAISNTADDLLYQTERWDDTPAPELAYAIPVDNSHYEVTLHFAEIWSGAFAVGARVFDVAIEGATVLDDFDIYAEAGANTALTKTFHVEVSDGTLNILFSREVQNPKIAGIEVLGVISPPPPPPSAFRINTGGLSFVDTGGNTWEADAHFNTGNTFSTAAAISNTADDLLYQTERWDDTPAPELAYAIPVDNSHYEVTLHFAEIWSGAFAVGARVFDVAIEGATVLDDFDIYAEAGANTALTKTFHVEVSDGTLNILFSREVQNPKIAGIEAVRH